MPTAKKLGNASTPSETPAKKQPTPKPPATPKAAKKAKPVRDVKYPELAAVVLRDEHAMTAEQAKAHLGWLELPADAAKDQEHHLVDLDGKKIFLANSSRNRPISASWCHTLAETLLRRRWRLNGESVIITKTGEVASAQHRMAGLVLAEQMRTGPDAAHWKKAWPGPVTMECVLVVGVADDDETIDTLDTARPRTLSDVIYRREAFAKLKPSARRLAAKTVDWAIRNLWDRTHAGLDAWSPVRTHPESIAFWDAHPKLTKCVTHVVEEDGDTQRRISTFFKLGHAAALMYMMAACETDGEKYKESRHERRVDLSNWDKAEEFWTLLASAADGPLKLVRQCLGGLGDQASRDELTAVVIKAWNAWAVGDKLTEGLLALDYREDEDGVTYLAETPVIGGIDFGPSSRNTREDDPDPADIEAAKAKIKAENGHAGAGDDDEDDLEEDEADPTDEDLEAGGSDPDGEPQDEPGADALADDQDGLSAKAKICKRCKGTGRTSGNGKCPNCDGTGEE